MSNYDRSINRIFTKKVIGDLINNGSNDVFDYVVQRYLVAPESKTYGEIISEIYACLSDCHRNEYYYMNTLLNKLLVGIHSVNTTTALSQVRIANHIADFVMINGEGRVYEIKSDLDNMERLSDQLCDYFKAFSKVSILSSENEIKHIEHILTDLGDMGEAVGIYVLTENDTIFSKTNGRDPQEFTENLEYRNIFTLLRKKEYENIIKEYFGEIPEVAPVFHFKTCLNLFSQIPILTAQNLAFAELKKRNKITKITFESIPKELKSVIYFSGFSNHLSEIENLLQKKYKEVI